MRRMNFPTIAKPIHFRLDSDRDGVYDWKDCQPFNPFKQDDMYELHNKLLKTALETYASLYNMEADIREATKAFIYNGKKLYSDFRMRWFSKSDDIFIIEDISYNLLHFIYMDTNGRIYGLVSTKKDIISSTRLENLVYWAYDKVKNYIKEKRL